MALGKEFEAFASERLSVLGEISVRRMFGGAGVYCDGLFFALLDDDELYLKSDDETRATYEAAGLTQFSYQLKDGPRQSMAYYRAPEEVFDDEDELRRWARLALGAAARAAAKKPKKAAKKTLAKKAAKSAARRSRTRS